MNNQSDETEKTETAKREEEILAFWNTEKVYEQSLEQTKHNKEFVFYDGPPFATGLPHSGSLLSSVIKDVIPRYKTMRGFFVRRRWGWDTHGLPIESLVEKKLGLKTKKDILDIGIEKFNEEARGLVLGYVNDWHRYVNRIGRWVDFDNSYKTMDNSFIESVWWGIQNIHTQGKLYEGKKVLMYCPHCETPLAKAEIAMDNTYKDITEEAVTVKFKVKNPELHGLLQDTHILAWTTTPWTLPGNVALAVGIDITYALIEEEGQRFLMAQSLYKGEGSVVKEFSGADLVGIEYEPLYEIKKALMHDGKKYEVVSADFVSTEDGVGVVHTAVMYGEDDFVLGQKENLPMVQLLEPNGTYGMDAPEFVQGKYIKDAERDIKRDLTERGLLFAKANNTHSYPHCYRCDTPLIYNALSSWFIDIQSVKQKLLSENEKVNWVPDNLKHGRFKHIVENAPDWGISRNRFWATPLPIWKDSDGNVTVIGSLAELRERTKKSGNTYLVMRHGQAQANAGNRVSSYVSDKNTLTEQGEAEAAASGVQLAAKGIDMIIASPLIRAKQTAEIVATSIGIAKEDIVYDERLQEINAGVFDKKSNTEFHEFFENSYTKMFEKRPEGGENLADVRRRVGEFLYEIEKTYSGKTILVVCHEYPLWMMGAIVKGLSVKEAVALKEPLPEYVETGGFRSLDFVPLPHNRDYELDFHRPYIDEVQLENEKGEALERIPEVVDCWLESSSMPFAEYHYPFENKEEFEKRAPGDFIAEYIAQTRTWFYYMHAMGVLLFDRRAFKNVVSTGTVLAADGQKISKSKNNYTDPYVLFDTYGADAFRFYFMSSVVMQAEDMLFKDEDLRDVHNKVVNILRNTFTFYQLYKDSAPLPHRNSVHTLDRWILARLDETLATTTEALDKFDTVRATRPLRVFIDDFSTWYVRRSRDRVKEGGKEGEEALATMRYVLREFSKIIAPVMPFIADEIFREVRTDADPLSVHLARWPESKKEFFGFLKGNGNTEQLLEDMAQTRTAITAALKERQVANIKVRQPLASITLKDERLRAKKEFLALILDEVNVKEVLFDTALTDNASLDTAMTPALKEEGQVREVMRFIQDLRKKAGLEQKDEAVLLVSGNEAGLAFLDTYWDDIQKTTTLSGKKEGEGELAPIEGVELFLAIET